MMLAASREGCQHCIDVPNETPIVLEISASVVQKNSPLRMPLVNSARLCLRGKPSNGANGIIFGGSFPMPFVLRWFPRWCKKILLARIP
jgi:hypothetical protein